MKLKREFYLKNGVALAKDLLGKVLVHTTAEGTTKGIIVETEAYMGKLDDAAHSYKKSAHRTNIQYKKGGFAYIYMIYGKHYCMNVVANLKDIPESVLLRALEPIDGIEIMQARRNKDNIQVLCQGPGNLAKAMGITKNQYGYDMCGNQLYIENGPVIDFKIVATKRINIEYAASKDNLWRFIIKNNKFVSKLK